MSIEHTTFVDQLRSLGQAPDAYARHAEAAGHFLTAQAVATNHDLSTQNVANIRDVTTVSPDEISARVKELQDFGTFSHGFEIPSSPAPKR